MESVQVDLIPVLLATFSGMVLGALWYSPVAFGNQWLEQIGKTKEELGSATGPTVGSIVASLLTAVGVALVMSWSGVESNAGALGLGLCLGLLIIFPAMLSDNLFCGWGSKLLWIQTGYRALSVTLMSVIVALMA